MSSEINYFAKLVNILLLCSALHYMFHPGERPGTNKGSADGDGLQTWQWPTSARKSRRRTASWETLEKARQQEQEGESEKTQ